jgi:hypothetical protein
MKQDERYFKLNFTHMSDTFSSSFSHSLPQPLRLIPCADPGAGYFSSHSSNNINSNKNFLYCYYEKKNVSAIELVNIRAIKNFFLSFNAITDEGIYDKSFANTKVQCQ